MTSVDFLPCFLSEPERKGTGTFNVDRPPSWGNSLGFPCRKFKRSYGSFLKWEVPLFYHPIGSHFNGESNGLGYPKFKKHANKYSVRVCHMGMAWYIISKIRWSTKYAKTWNERPFKIIWAVPTDMSILEPKVCVPDLGIDGIDPI